jgi:hypothetical protein
MACGTERHQAVEIEVRAALGALDDVVDLEAGADPAGLAAPLGSRQDLRADFAPGFDIGRRSTERQWPTCPDPAPRGLTDPDARAKYVGAPHAGQTEVCPRGQTGEVDAAADPRDRLAACSSHSGRHSRQPARKIAIGFGEPTTRFPR